MKHTTSTQVKSRKAEQAEATRAALIAAARGLFAERGYAGVSTEQIVGEARVTRGALYHHFRDKRDLFGAVFEQIESELAGEIGAVALANPSILDGLGAGIDAFLLACDRPEVQRIALLEAPGVLGWEDWREIEERYALGLIVAALGLAVDQGLIEPQPVEPLAHVLLGALIEAGHLVARAEDPEAARVEVGAALRRILEGLRIRS